MQDRYAADAGDFMKLGLLRALIQGTSLRLGINWYLVPDEAHNADGKHVAYLQPHHARHVMLSGCDPDLMKRFGTIDLRQRSVEALERCGALPLGSLTYRERLQVAMPPAARSAWHSNALSSLAAADVVFLDPDNGLSTRFRGSRSHKYAMSSELADYAARGQSLIVYHHADRTRGGVATQVPRQLDELAEATGVPAAGAIVTRLGSVRYFLLAPAPSHRARMSSALVSYISRWGACAEFIATTSDAEAPPAGA